MLCLSSLGNLVQVTALHQGASLVRLWCGGSCFVLKAELAVATVWCSFSLLVFCLCLSKAAAGREQGLRVIVLVLRFGGRCCVWLSCILLLFGCGC